MKLEDQFFHFFFYPFLIGVAFSAIIVILCSYIFTDSYLDKKTGDNIIKLGKEYSIININSINSMVSSILLKNQLSLNELFLAYQNLAKKIKNITDPNINRIINDKYLKCVLDLNDTILDETNDETNYIAYWLIDLETNLTKLKNNSIEKNQLITFSSLMANLFSTFYSINMTSKNFYFYFESTELFISFPLIYDIKNGFISEIINFTTNQVWCTDEKGEIYSYYRTKCREFYINIKKAKSDVFDINYKDNENRTIFVTEFYLQTGTEIEIVFSICIEFIDPISNKLAYVCSDVNSNDLNYNLDNINNKLSGYFFINSVGFAHSFYFPGSVSEALTNTEYLYSWGKNFYLEEKTYFSNNIQKYLTSNYIKYLNGALNSEIFINGINGDKQIINIDGEKYNFSIYPVVLENYNGNKEHVLNIIFVYSNKLFYEEIKTDTDILIKILIELIIFIVFGSGLLYLIILSFNILAKYIVIPIKNVNYMLKGINIGGKNRLEYLNFLKKKQDDNAELLEKMYFEENKKNKNNDESSNQLKDENNNVNENNKGINEAKSKKNELVEDPLIMDNNDNNEQDNTKSTDDIENNELINSDTNYYKKYQEENDFIEKESTFYNFNEQLLEFRPLEINRLVKVLIDLKGALLLTSTDQQVEEIINYSNSEEIFRNFKNNEGTTICQSNIGNLQSQLLKFDKAIYHLATSLQDNKLKKFLSRALSDELDENDILLNKISTFFHIDKTKVKNNVLAEKQLNNSKNNFSQKIIGILINSRYNKLIHVYFRFFSLIQKLNDKVLDGLFINTYFHNINYYHKILIQYIYLCFVKNDLVKIGESILDYIEFLIKFKFKTSAENEYLFDIRNRDRIELKKKLKYKRNIFNKIINWFNLFDEYVYHVRNNTSLDDEKSLIDDFTNLVTENNEFNSGSQSVFLFKVNIQRSEFLKGKFAMRCHNYTDALFFFIRSAKKKSIVIDGLIKKKSLKRLTQILSKLFERYNDYGIIEYGMKEKIFELEKLKSRYFSKKNTSKSVNINYINNLNENEYKQNWKWYTFKKEMMIIKNDLINDTGECNVKQKKDIIVIIDFNLYNKEQEPKDINNTAKIDSFIDQAKIILDNYLSNNDRYGVFIYKNDFQIICPLLEKNKIDLESFSKDLIYYKKYIFKEKDEEDGDSNMNEVNENYFDKEKIEIQSGQQNLSGSGSQESINNNSVQTKSEDIIIKGLIETINYSQNYFQFKECNKNEKYIILFTDMFNIYRITDDLIISNFVNLNGEKEIIFLLAGKNKERDIKYNKNKSIDSNEDIKINKLIINKFGERSEIIDYENMKKIKTILSSNNVIKDEIIYPNEIYK